VADLGNERVLAVSKSVRGLAELIARKVLTISFVFRKVLTISTGVSTASVWDARARPALMVSKSTQEFG
jgi:hypothetical protein